jgi:hypothetical protein
LDAHVDYLGELTDRSLLPVNHCAVLLVGSCARGWSNSKSDYDIYVVSTEAWSSDTCDVLSLPLNPPTVLTESFYANGRRWEVTHWQDSQVDQMLAKVSWAEFERERTAGQVLSYKEEIFLDRLASCLALSGAEWLADRRATLAESAFRSFLVARSLDAADDSVEDALGQLDAGELESAVLAARKALGHTVDAVLEQHGEYGAHAPKWRPQRFRAAKPSALSFEEYWTLETMSTFDPADPAKWVNSVLTLCQDISMKVEI